MLNNLNFFKNKKILITGHTGFKGSWLSLINQVGAKVIGYSKPFFENDKHFQMLSFEIFNRR